jgi:hypothetical protein
MDVMHEQHGIAPPATAAVQLPEDDEERVVQAAATAAVNVETEDFDAPIKGRS